MKLQKGPLPVSLIGSARISTEEQTAPQVQELRDAGCVGTEEELGYLTADANLALSQGSDDMVLVSIKNEGAMPPIAD